MSRTAGRLIVVLLLAVFVLLALLLRTQSSASAPGSVQFAPPISVKRSRLTRYRLIMS
jgi:hypothetical protein